MVTPARRVACEPDRLARIRQLRRALLPAALVDGLKRHWPDVESDGRKLLGCDPIRVHPRGKDAFIIEYVLRLEVDGSERAQPVFGELVGDAAQARYQQLLRRLQKPRRGQLTDTGAKARVGCIPPLGLVLCVPGLDERLYGLKLFHQPALFKPDLSQSGVSGNLEVNDIDAQLLGHRLGKRCIVRFRFTTRDPRSGESSTRSLIAKMYKYYSDRGQAIAAVMQQLRDHGFDGSAGFGIPKPLAHLQDWRILLMEDIRGTPIAELADRDWTAGVAGAGRVLAKLHHCPVRVTGTHAVDDEIALLTRWVSLVSEIEPNLREPLTNGLANVSAGLRCTVAREPALVHRDFYDKQVLMAGDLAVLIDFDTLCMSDPALDLGNFIAHLRFEGPQGATGLESAFLDGYGSTPDEGAVDVYVKSAFLRLACIHSFCEHRRPNVERVLEIL